MSNIFDDENPDIDESDKPETELIIHNGNDIIKYEYDRKIEFENCFRNNHINTIQYLYGHIKDYLNDCNIEQKFELQEFIDFCLENSIVIEEKNNDSDSDDD
jgi:hypothetical protein